jgi:hypothetical protein
MCSEGRPGNRDRRDYLLAHPARRSPRDASCLQPFEDPAEASLLHEQPERSLDGRSVVTFYGSYLGLYRKVVGRSAIDRHGPSAQLVSLHSVFAIRLLALL